MPTVSNYQVRAALWVVGAIDSEGSDTHALDAAFHDAVTQGRFSRSDLDNALRLLVARGLVLVQEQLAVRHASLEPLLALADTDAVALLSEMFEPTAMGEDADVARRELLGVLGEEAVVNHCIAEIVAIARLDLIPQVQRVSLVSDRFGYDVSAPAVIGETRRLEVKTAGSKGAKTFRFFLSRNEYEVGRRNPRSWAMVACTSDGESAAIVGWCRASELERYLPDDGNVRWTEAVVSLPMHLLLPGVPSAIP